MFNKYTICGGPGDREEEEAQAPVSCMLTTHEGLGRHLDFLKMFGKWANGA